MAKVRSGELAREARQGPAGWQHSKRSPRGDVRGVSERVLPPPRPAPWPGLSAAAGPCGAWAWPSRAQLLDWPLDELQDASATSSQLHRLVREAGRTDLVLTCDLLNYHHDLLD